MIGDHDPAPKPSLEERRRTSRIRWTAGIGAVLAACLAAALAIAMTRDTTREQEGTPRLRLRPCTLGVETPARCGRLLVPENRANPSGRKISLRVAVIPSPVQPADGALFYLEGGPGGAATAVAPAVNDLFGKVNAHRDLVFVDQRGTGGSHAMQCPQEHVPLHGAPARVAGYIERCFAHLDGDPRFYTSAPAADDLEDVRKALGYGPIDLFGTSYGATLAQIFLRLHPGAVRTMTLDGASLLNVPLYELQGRNTERALDSQLARCARPARLPHGIPVHAAGDRPAARPEARLDAPARVHAGDARPGRYPAHAAGAARGSLPRGPPPGARAPGRRRQLRPPRGRVRHARGRRPRRPRAPRHGLGDPLQRALGAVRCRRDPAREPGQLPRPRSGAACADHPGGVRRGAARCRTARLRPAPALECSRALPRRTGRPRRSAGERGAAHGILPEQHADRRARRRPRGDRRTAAWPLSSPGSSTAEAPARSTAVA